MHGDSLDRAGWKGAAAVLILEMSCGKVGPLLPDDLHYVKSSY